MTDSRQPRLVARGIALVLLAIVSTVSAFVVTFVASDLQLQVNDYYSGPQTGSQSEIQALSTLAFSLTNFAPALLTTAGVAAFGALALLAIWWQRREDQAVGTDSVQVDSDEPTAASTS